MMNLCLPCVRGELNTCPQPRGHCDGAQCWTWRSAVVYVSSCHTAFNTFRMENTKKAVDILKEIHMLATASHMDYLANKVLECIKLLK